MGTPSGDTTSFFFPSTVTVSVRWFFNGVVWAKSFAQIGAATHRATTTSNTAPHASAGRLRGRRRTASRQGPSPETRCRFASSSNAAGPSNANSVRSAALPLYRRRLQAELQPVVLVVGVHAVAVLRVHPLGEERRGLLGAVGSEVRLVLDDVLVQVGVLARDLLWVLLDQVRNLLVEHRVVHVAGVERRRRRQSCAGQRGLEQVGRVREVHEPVGEPDLGLVPLLTDLAEVHLLVQDLELGLVADLVEQVAHVVADRGTWVLAVGPHGHALAGGARLLHEVLGLRHVARTLRIAVRARTVLVPDHV